GWDSNSDNKVGATEKPRGHGANRRAKAFRSSLPITLEVAFIGEDIVDYKSARHQIAALGAEGPELMTVIDELGTMSRLVTIEHTDIPDDHGWASQDGISIDMTAEDPRKYGLPQTDTTGLPTPGTGLVYPIVYPLDWGQPGEGGSISLTNMGTAAAAPVFRVEGGLSSVTITESGTGKRLILNRPIPVGSVVEFDGRTRRVTLDGVTDISSTFLTRREWPLIAPGHTSTFLFSGTSTGGVPSLTGELQSAWW
ncbi:MAG: hypothetical protein ABWX92_12375, partial [Mycetocola sp.]